MKAYIEVRTPEALAILKRFIEAGQFTVDAVRVVDDVLGKGSDSSRGIMQHGRRKQEQVPVE